MHEILPLTHLRNKILLHNISVLLNIIDPWENVIYFKYVLRNIFQVIKVVKLAEKLNLNLFTKILSIF